LSAIAQARFSVFSSTLFHTCVPLRLAAFAEIVPE